MIRRFIQLLVAVMMFNPGESFDRASDYRDQHQRDKCPCRKISFPAKNIATWFYIPGTEVSCKDKPCMRGNTVCGDIGLESCPHWKGARE